MSWPPMLMHIKVRNVKTNFGCWIPLFLFYPIVLAVLLVLLPFILIGIFIAWLMGYGNWMRFILKTSFTMFWSLRGLKVDVQGRKDIVHFSII